MDLRKEFTNLLKYELGGIGRWVVVRKFSTVHSQYWNEAAHEAIGGPAYDFTDTLVEAYSIPMRRISPKTDGVWVQEVGKIEQELIIFYFEYNVSFDVDDEIFELDYEKSTKPTLVYTEAEEDIANGKVAPKSRYKVKKKIKYRCDEGMIEFLVAYTQKTIER